MESDEVHDRVTGYHRESGLSHAHHRLRQQDEANAHEASPRGRVIDSLVIETEECIKDTRHHNRRHLGETDTIPAIAILRQQDRNSRQKKHVHQDDHWQTGAKRVDKDIDRNARHVLWPCKPEKVSSAKSDRPEEVKRPIADDDPEVAFPM